MMIERPKVTSSGTSRSFFSVRLRISRCSAQPSANMKGMAMRIATHAGQEEVGHQRQQQVGREHDEVAVREIDEPHDAEDQREASRVDRVEAADERTLDERVEEAHACSPK